MVASNTVVPRTGQAGALLSSQSALPPPTVRYVVQGAEAGGNGSIAAPYATMAEGLAALDALAVADPAGSYVLVLGPGNYSAETLPDWTTTATLTLAALVSGSGSAFASQFGPRINGFALAGGQLCLLGLYHGVGATRIEGSGGLIAANCYLGGPDLEVGGDLFLAECQLYQCNLQASLIRLEGCNYSGPDPLAWAIGSGQYAQIVDTQIGVAFAIDFSPSVVGVLEIDSFSNYSFVAQACSLMGGTKTVVSSLV